ncbi:3-deoxy-manno-octulosonate cytidylyltransferase [Alphaproteobacteria bacterium]|nr:3-deoxy-manno-octulosonate cytidylyltransferase [Alphaproteobacteria bacterium]
MAEISGKPLIIRVLEQAKSLDFCECYVACCSEEIKEVVENYGGKAILTDPELPSGTDRIFAASKTLHEKQKFIINLQGDNPIFDESILPILLNILEHDETIDIATPVTLKKQENGMNDPNIVKVVFNNMESEKPGRALYFSRNAMPHGTDYFYAHIGIYAYRADALSKFVSLKPTYLEQTERLEQLRALQHGMNICAIPTCGTYLSVDTENDINSVEEFLYNN